MITSDRVPGAERALRRRWLGAATLGGFLGFLIPAVATLAIRTATPGTQAALVLIAGSAQGAVLGWCQARVLRSVLTRFSARDWVLASAAGATVAWGAGMLSLPYAETSAALPAVAQVPTVVAAALVVVFAVGVAQASVLSRWTDRAALWAWGNAVAWIAGLSVFATVTGPLRPAIRNPALGLASGGLGGLAMAVVVAAVTGTFLRCVVAPGHVRSRPDARRVVRQGVPVSEPRNSPALKWLWSPAVRSAVRVTGYSMPYR